MTKGRRFSKFCILLLAGSFLLTAGCARNRSRIPGDVYMPPERPRLTVPPYTPAATNVIRPALPPPRLETTAVKPPPVTVAPVTIPKAATIPDQSFAYKLRSGDPVVIFLRGILPKDDQIEDIIDDGGYVKLPYLDNILAAGKTTSQLENEIQRLYVDRQIYKNITVNVVMPSQSFFVRGEVRNPGRFAIVTGITLVQAIASAGGFTDYADRTDVKIIRGGKSTRFNARDLERHPERDVRIEPGDVIVVERSMF